MGSLSEFNGFEEGVGSTLQSLKLVAHLQKMRATAYGSAYIFIKMALRPGAVSDILRPS